MLLSSTIFLPNRHLPTGFTIKIVYALTVSSILPINLAHSILNYLIDAALQHDLRNSKFLVIPTLYNASFLNSDYSARYVNNFFTNILNLWTGLNVKTECFGTHTRKIVNSFMVKQYPCILL